MKKFTSWRNFVLLNTVSKIFILFVNVVEPSLLRDFNTDGWKLKYIYMITFEYIYMINFKKEYWIKPNKFGESKPIIDMKNSWQMIDSK